MRTRCLFLYRWATVGGVERVILNRAMALQKAGEPVEFDVHFYQDAGGLQEFARSVAQLGLDGLVRLVHRPAPERYDAVFAIDTPAAFDEPGLRRSRLIIECHSANPHGRRYLARLDGEVGAIVGPSPAFVETLARELPRLAGRMHVLRNFVSLQPERPDEQRMLRLPAWTWRLLFCIGRLDALKNPAGLLDGLRLLVRGGHDFGAVFVGPLSPEVDLDREIRARELHGRVVWLPPVRFDRIGPLLRAARRAQGLYVSCSRAESFGLAAAEAAAAGLPTLLSDLPAYRALVCDDSRLLFALDDPAALAGRVLDAAARYEELSIRCTVLAQGFSPERFMQDWKRLLDTIA